MAIKNFHGVDTTSAGKLNAIKSQIKYYESRKKIPGSFTGLGLCLPGDVCQINRHVKELEYYGITADRQIMVDYNTAIHRDHIKWKSDTGYQGKLMNGKLNDIVSILLNNGEKISVIDYDDVKNFSIEHTRLIELAAKNGVEAINLITTSRSSIAPPEIVRWSNILNVPLRRFTRGEHRVNLVAIQQQAIEYLANQYNYNVYFIPYCGTNGFVPMLATVMLKK